MISTVLTILEIQKLYDTRKIVYISKNEPNMDTKDLLSSKGLLCIKRVNDSLRSNRRIGLKQAHTTQKGNWPN